MEESGTHLVDRWRSGDEEAATELYQRYIQRLLNVVNMHLTQRIRAQVEADDICQSVFRSLFRRVQQGRFEFHDDGDLWKLMVTVALNKVRNRVRFLGAGKRDVAREVHARDASEPDAFVVHSLSREPSIEEAAEFQDLVEKVCRQLPPETRELLRLRMDGYSQEEIAERLSLCTRTIRRMNERIRDQVVSILKIDGAERPS
jgi:RNA polymerase sigma-70 factor (ECF subfamily)